MCHRGRGYVVCPYEEEQGNGPLLVGAHKMGADGALLDNGGGIVSPHELHMGNVSRLVGTDGQVVGIASCVVSPHVGRYG